MAEQVALGFGDLLRQLRAEAGLTQEELAEAAGLSPRSVSDLERGIHPTARKDTAELLAGALGLAESARPLFVAAARGRAPAEQVLATLRGEAAPGGAAGGQGLAWPGGPYLGLVPFEERDARLFYGRDELADQLVRRLAGRPDGAGILLVAGESGSGKSSLLRAGLLPRLAAGALGPGSQRWPRRVIRPTASPLRELAMHLAEMAGADPVSVYRSLVAAPDEAPMLAEQAARTATGRAADPGLGGPAGTAAGAPPRLVLVVDQFEELYTVGEGAGAGAAERTAFVTALHAAATIPAAPGRVPPALVVAAVRADYLGHLIADPRLKAALDAGPFTVGPMTEAELRLAVTGPAAEAGLVVEPAVVEAVITELRGEAGGGLGSGILPLMSQAMAATWEHREGNELTLRGYRRAGGVADAVNRGAQAAYDALTGPRKEAARLVFTQLTVITADGQFARRRCRRSDLSTPGTQMAADIDAVIGVFSARRLLVLGHDSVEISHDALLQAWKQLRDWLGDGQLDRALYGQVVTDADTWESNGRDSAYLYRPGRLATIDAAAARWRDGPARYPPLPATSGAFLGAARHAARRATRRRRSVIAGLLALTVIAVSAAGIAARDAANASRQAANAARQHAIALSRQLAAESVAAQSTHPLTARRLAAAAWRISPTSQASSALAHLLMEQQQGGILPGNPANGGAGGMAFSPDGKLLATGYGSGYVRLWDPATGQAIGSPLLADTSPEGNGGVTGVAFSPDGKLLATAGGDGTVRLWNTATRQAARAPLPANSNGSVAGVAFSPDGKLLATAGGDGYVRLWNPATGQPVGSPLPADTSPDGVDAVAFSPDGKLLASADADGTVRLWNPATRQAVGSPIPAVTRPGAGVGSVAFSPDGKTLASGGDGYVRLWNTATRQPVGAPLHASARNGGIRWVLGVAFSPDGKLLASAGWDGTVRLWDPATRQPAGAPLRPVTNGGRRWLVGVAFSPDGKLLASAGGDGAVRLWNPATRQAPRTPLPAVAGGVNAVAFSPDGKLLATAGGDGTVGLWDPATGQAAGAPLPAETGSGAHVFEVAFSPDGKLLATAAGDGTVGLWNTATQQASGVFPGIKRMAFSPDGKLLATAGGDGSVRMWDLATRQAIGAPLPADYGGDVTGVAFSPDGKLLATAGGDGVVRLWNTATRQAAGAPLRAVTDGSGVTAVTFSPDGKLLASAGGDGTVRLWDPATRQAAGALHPAEPGGGVQAVAFSPDGKLLAAAYSDGVVRLWNTATRQAAGAPLPAGTGSGGSVLGVAFSPDGKLLASADADGSVRTWPMPLFADPYTALCADVGPPTKAEWTRYAPGETQPSICR
jgi:WD40 repeat protein/transcriptional regulator with XRE-family HTH domain